MYFFAIHFIVHIKNFPQSICNTQGVYIQKNKIGCDSIKVLAILIAGKVNVQTPLKCLIYT